MVFQIIRQRDGQACRRDRWRPKGAPIDERAWPSVYVWCSRSKIDAYFISIGSIEGAGQ